MPKLTASEWVVDVKDRIINPWIQGAFDEVLEYTDSDNPDETTEIQLLDLLKSLGLHNAPDEFILANPLFEKARGVYSFAGAFVNSHDGILKNDEINPKELHQLITYLARSKLCELIAKKMKDLDCLDNDWLIQAQTILHRDHKKIESNIIAKKGSVSLVLVLSTIMLTQFTLGMFEAYQAYTTFNPHDKRDSKSHFHACGNWMAWIALPASFAYYYWPNTNKVKLLFESAKLTSEEEKINSIAEKNEPDKNSFKLD